MRLHSVEIILEELETAAVRYLIAGGLAVNAHGYLRFTKDVDLVIELEPDNLRSALWRPLAGSVTGRQCQCRSRSSRIRCGGNPGCGRRACRSSSSAATLIRMKEVAGRPQDLIDIEHLRMRQRDHE